MTIPSGTPDVVVDDKGDPMSSCCQYEVGVRDSNVVLFPSVELVEGTLVYDADHQERTDDWTDADVPYCKRCGNDLAFAGPIEAK